LLRDPQARSKLGVDPGEAARALTPRNGFRFSAGGGRHFSTQPGVSATNVILEGNDPVDLEQLIRQVKNGLYIGRIWYTYPINGLRAGDFTCTAVGDSYIIKDGQIVAPLKPNTIRINDSILRLLKNIVGVTKEAKGTLVWAADEVVYAPEVAIQNVRVDEIAQFMDNLG
jgi:PmbA protein